MAVIICVLGGCAVQKSGGKYASSKSKEIAINNNILMYRNALNALTKSAGLQSVLTLTQKNKTWLESIGVVEKVLVDDYHAKGEQGDIRSIRVQFKEGIEHCVFPRELNFQSQVAERWSTLEELKIIRIPVELSPHIIESLGSMRQQYIAWPPYVNKQNQTVFTLSYHYQTHCIREFKLYKNLDIWASNENFSILNR